jgi:4'-phosphopantetheinyl transferase
MRRVEIIDRSETARVVVRWCRVAPDFPKYNILTLLDDDEQHKAASLKFEVDRQAYIAAHGLLRLVAAQEFDARTFDLRYAASGKPEIVGAGVGTIDISLSHTRGVAAVGLTRNGRIGVDVEAGHRNELLKDVASLAFSAAERAELARTPDEEQQAQFLTIWTLKESVVKATGQGLSVPLQKFTTCSNPVGLMISPDDSDPAYWRLHSMALEGGCRLAVALKLESNLERVIFDVKEYLDLLR